MLFTGEYEHTIDAKRRLAIPAEIRACLDADEHGVALYAAPGPNGALWLWPERTFERMASALDQSLLPAEEMMEFEELLFSQAQHLDIDKTGRVRLPERLLNRAGLKSCVVILGVKDHLELRAPAQWAALLEEKLSKQAQIMMKARQAMLAQHRNGHAHGQTPGRKND